MQHRSSSNTDARTRQLAGAINGISQCRSAHTLRRLLGWTSWYSSHFPGASRALGPAYTLLQTSLRNGLPWGSLWGFAVAIALGCCQVEWCADAMKGVCVLYADACAASRTVGVCSHNGSRGFTTQVPSGLMVGYAKDSDAQQTAELYGVCLSAVTAALAGRSALVFTDRACLGWFSGERQPPALRQAQLLLGTSILKTLSAVDLTVRWVPGKLNLADSWSRRQLNATQDAQSS